MRYMIHSAPERQWYVDEFLVPSMLEQGIREKDIFIRCDTERKGNLVSCMESFLWCGQNTDGGTWHLQDDILISHSFAERTKQYDNGVVCGMVVKKWGPDWLKTGEQKAADHWYSFQCIRVPDSLAGECAVWFFSDASKRTQAKYRNRVLRKKHDDDFFRFFLEEKHPEMTVLNLKPNLVDHIDYLIGGTLVNKDRIEKVNRAAYWEDEDEKLVEKLWKQMQARNQNGLSIL